MDSIHSSKLQQTEELEKKKSEMKLHPKSMCVTGSGRVGAEIQSCIPTRCIASQRERSCTGLQICLDLVANYSTFQAH